MSYTIIAALIFRIIYLFKHNINITGSVDPFSTLLGLLGIAISWIIFVYVKQDAEKKDGESKGKIEQLNASVANITNSVTSMDKSVFKINNLLKEYSSIEPVHGLRGRLAYIGDVYNHSLKKGNDLYIMTHSIGYGNVLAQEVKCLISDVGRDEKATETLGDLYRNDIKPVLKQIESLMELLLNELPENTHVVTLEKERYARMTDKIIDKHKVRCISKWDKDTFNRDELINYYLYHNVGNIPESEIGESESKEKLIKHLKDYDEMGYKRLKDSRVKVTRVNYLPFQFIARIPKEAVSKDEEITFDAKCVLMFSNLYNISDEETTACFSSVNDKLIKNLKDVFDNLVQRRKEIEIREDQHKRIFGIRALQETVFVMHEAETKNLAEAKYLIRVRFRDDVIAETKIKLLFRNKFKDHQHLLRDDFLADNVGLLEDASASTIITIGLFENAITEKLVGKNRSRTGKGDELFYIEQDGTTGAKRVCVKCQDTPTVNHPETFESEYDPQAESFDYAIFAKILYKNKTIIICGGCESYGTSRIGEYIYENIDKIINDGEAKRDSTLKTHYTNPEFVSIYKIPSAAKAPITLEGHFTK